MLARGEFSGIIPMTLTPDLRTILTLSIRADVVPDCEIAKTTSFFESELADINCMCGSEINDDDIYVSDLKSKNNKLWILNYGVENPLLSFDGDSEWLKYNINYQSNIFPKSFE